MRSVGICGASSFLLASVRAFHTSPAGGAITRSFSSLFFARKGGGGRGVEGGAGRDYTFRIFHIQAVHGE